VKTLVCKTVLVFDYLVNQLPFTPDITISAAKHYSCQKEIYGAIAANLADLTQNYRQSGNSVREHLCFGRCGQGILRPDKRKNEKRKINQN
jgi:hypothetical protein